MSTPLAFFRKHQKIMITVIGGLLAVALVIPAAVTYSFTDGGRKTNQEDEGDQVMIVIDGEEITKDQLNLVRYHENSVARVLATAIQQAFFVNGQPVPPPANIPAVQILPPNQQMPIGRAQPLEVDDNRALQLMLLRKKGKEIGITISDDAVTQFIRKTTGNAFPMANFDDGIDTTGKKVPGIITMAQGGNKGYTYDEFFEMLRDTLVAQKTATLLMSGAQVSTPATAWSAFRDLNRTVNAEFFPIKVEDFIDQVPTPSETELQEFFKEHRPFQRNPMINQVGFRQLEKIELTYFKGEYEDFLAREKEAVTQEQMEEYYEKNKETFRKISLPESPSNADPSSDESTSENDSTEKEPDSATDTVPIEKNSEDSPTTDAAEKDETDSEKPDEATDSEESTEEKNADSSTTDAETDDTKTGDSATDSDDTNSEDPGNEETSQVQAKVKSFPVNFLQEDGEEETTEDDQTKEEKSESATEKPPETDSDSKEAETKEDEKDNSAEPESTETKKDNNEDTVENANETKEVASDVASETEDKVEYKPISEVEEEIRNAIARPLATEKYTQAINTVRDRLDTLYEKSKDALYDDDDSTKFLPYEGTDLEALAKENDLMFGKLPLSDFYEARDDEVIGDITHTQFIFQPSFQQRTISFVDVVLGQETPLFKSRLFPGQAATQNRFSRTPDTQVLFFATDRKDGFLPEYDQVKDQVLASWKKQEAINLAEEAAKKMTADAATKMSLKEIAKQESDVIVAEGVTYFNPLSLQQGQPQMGDIPGVEDAGMKLMNAVFDTEEGQASFGPNQPEDIYYVIKVTSQQQDDEQLQQQLLSQTIAGLPARAADLSGGRNAMVINNMLRDLFDQYEVLWVQNPRAAGDY